MRRLNRVTFCYLECFFSSTLTSTGLRFSLYLFCKDGILDANKSRQMSSVGSMLFETQRSRNNFSMPLLFHLNPSIYSWLNLPLIMDFLFNFTRISFFLASVSCLLVSSLNKSFEHLGLTRLLTKPCNHATPVIIPKTPATMPIRKKFL